MGEPKPNGVNPADIVVLPTRVESEAAFPLSFFTLQSTYAGLGIELGKAPEWAYKNLTSFWLRVGGSKYFPQFTKEVQEGSKPDEVAYRMYLKFLPQDVDDRRWFGCHTYDYNPEGRSVDIHFTNHDESDAGPLSESRQAWRKAELRAMFSDIKARHPSARMVKGASWLYNHPRYTKLLPPVFTNPDHVEVWETKHATNQALWGQFLDKRGNVIEIKVNEFLERARRAENLEELLASFPYKVVLPSANIEYFFDFYGVS